MKGLIEWRLGLDLFEETVGSSFVISILFDQVRFNSNLLVYLFVIVIPIFLFLMVINHCIVFCRTQKRIGRYQG